MCMLLLEWVREYGRSRNMLVADMALGLNV